MIADYSFAAMENALKKRVFEGMNIEDYFDH
jgi:hypothetical protein